MARLQTQLDEYWLTLYKFIIADISLKINIFAIPRGIRNEYCQNVSKCVKNETIFLFLKKFPFERFIWAVITGRFIPRMLVNINYLIGFTPKSRKLPITYLGEFTPEFRSGLIHFFSQ